jgi:hypothetical protein
MSPLLHRSFLSAFNGVIPASSYSAASCTFLICVIPQSL